MNLNDPQERLDGFFAEYEHAPPSSFQHVLQILEEKLAAHPTEKRNKAKGTVFEQLVKAFIEEDKAQSRRFDKVWMWNDYPDRGKRTDTGIDLVARERDGRGLIAIQCKFYALDRRIDRDEVNKFITASSTTEFSGGIFVSTTSKWTGHAEQALENRGDRPIQRWGPTVFENSSIDWQNFSLVRPKALAQRTTKTLREYQKQAVEDVLRGFAAHARGKLIMACGSGKTFTALRIAEQTVGIGGNVLFLTPSISLLSQSLLDWANDADLPLKTLAVCSDTRAGERPDDEDTSPYDLTEPASTDVAELLRRLQTADRTGSMTAVFSTYQSLDVVAAAQREGLPPFDLVICDEAHRTTGAQIDVMKDESGFRRIHDDDFLATDKRLYMTATPRIFGDQARRTATERQITLASMDDEELYGPVFHRLGFGKAVEMGILSDYKVLIFDVDQQQVGIDLHSLLSDGDSQVNMDNGARMVGCWNGLQKRGRFGVDFGRDTQPAKRAVAFANTIAHSELFARYFPQVIRSCIAAAQPTNEPLLSCEVQHVDGTQNALARAERLAWLRDAPPDGTCRILTNARCLTEGIDVPALDAILFLQPRRSEIDVVQAVGRVMRKSPDKRFGYIILPIAQSPGTSPQDTVNQSAYRAVWQVINAIAAHDDRFEAKINQLRLLRDSSEDVDYLHATDIATITGADDAEVDPSDPSPQHELPLLISGSPELRSAILAKVVDKYSNPKYWEQWAKRIRVIAEAHEARIRALLAVPGSTTRALFDTFLASIRQNLNDGVTEDDAIGMLSSHMVSKPVFDALFSDYPFIDHNPVSIAMEHMLQELQTHGLAKDATELADFYRDVRIRAEGVESSEGKQKIVAELYGRFFREAFPETAARLGIVYTPTEVVDWIIRSVEDVLRKDFDSSVADTGVHIFDPFTGTGTFVTRLLQCGLIPPFAIERKYREEIHANELMLLAYYIAAINIETTFHDIAAERAYEPFPGIVLTDTFDAYGPSDFVNDLLPYNNRRIRRQNSLDIRVILGNPPWSSTNNRAYSAIDERIKETYASKSRKTAVYDPYVRAIRQSSDRVCRNPNGGIVAFVTNGGFVDSKSFDGFRKALIAEFDAVYCYNLRGDQRTAGEKSKQEGGKVFGAESRAGVAILLLVRRNAHSPPAVLHYRDVGDYHDRETKLRILATSSLATTEWQVITPNEAGDWIGQRSDVFKMLRPLSMQSEDVDDGSPAAVFEHRTLGLVTARDKWCYASSRASLEENIKNTVEFYNSQVSALQRRRLAGTVQEGVKAAKSILAKDPSRFHWSRENYGHAAKGKLYSVRRDGFRVGAYRPFFKQHLYFGPQLNNSIRDFPSLYPEDGVDNRGIYLTGPGSTVPFTALMTNCITDSGLTQGNGSSPYFGRWRYVTRVTADGTSEERERISNINPQAVAEYRSQYGDSRISDDDLYYYVYGILHSDEWRKTFRDDLHRSHARIPMAETAQNFWKFVEAGSELAELHVNYESVDCYPLEEVVADGWQGRAADRYRVQKLTYAGRPRQLDKTKIVVNAGITLVGIPERAHNYRLGSRSALDWLVDRYRVKTYVKEGIVNDPNDWAAESGTDRYIVDLVKRITTVSCRTVDICQTLPALQLEKP